MTSLDRMSSLYGENGGMPSCQKIHDEPIYT